MTDTRAVEHGGKPDGSKCWCQKSLEYDAPGVFRWLPEYPPLRFPLGQEKP